MVQVHPELVPDANASREAMERLQRDVADRAVFADDLPFDLEAVEIGDAFDLGGGVPDPDSEFGDTSAPDSVQGPIVVGVDQAFPDERVVSAVVAVRDGRIVDRAHAVTPLEFPYVPGLLAFREAPPVLAALAELSVDPDLLVFDGSGRTHYREAGIATHVGVVVDTPAVGVAKNLLCGEPEQSLDEALPAGARVDVLADDQVDAANGTPIGQAFQSRQFDSPDRHVNPLYVSPGHRVSVETATDLVERTCAGYKLPEPTRLADAYADEVKRTLD